MRDLILIVPGHTRLGVPYAHVAQGSMVVATYRRPTLWWALRAAERRARRMAGVGKVRYPRSGVRGGLR